MDLRMKPHAKDADMIEIFLPGGRHLIGVVHVDTLYEGMGNEGISWGGEIYDRLHNGEELKMSLEIDDVAA